MNIIVIKRILCLFLFLIISSSLYSGEIIQVEDFESILQEMYYDLFSGVSHEESLYRLFDEDLLHLNKKELFDEFDQLMNYQIADSPDNRAWITRMTITVINLSLVSDYTASSRYLELLDHFYQIDNYVTEELLENYLFLELLRFYRTMEIYSFKENKGYTKLFFEKIDYIGKNYEKAYLDRFNNYYSSLKQLVIQ